MDTDIAIPIPGYRIEREIGRGGMSIVYLAQQESLGRTICLKVLSPELATDKQFTDRFLKEKSIIAQLNHPNIVEIYDFGSYENYYFLAMEYLSGGSLNERIRRGLPIDDSVSIVKAIASGLGYAHKRGYIHRDIKPSNILFREYGSPVITDFGIAKALSNTSSTTEVGIVVGSPMYMSPEQMKGIGVDARADLYGLGIVFYEMLTGSPPYQADETLTLALQHINEPIPRLPDHLHHFQNIINRLLAKEPADRFVDADRLIAALEQITLTPGASADVSSATRALTQSESAALPAKSLSAGWLTKLRALFSRTDSLEKSTPPTTKTIVDNSEPSADADLPEVPAGAQTGMQTSFIRSHALALLNPDDKRTIREFLLQEDPEQFAHHIMSFPGTHFVISGYGSFGGTTLTREICSSVRRRLENQSPHGVADLLVIRLQCDEHTATAASVTQFQAFLQHSDPHDDKLLARLTTAAEKPTDSYGLDEFFALLEAKLSRRSSDRAFDAKLELPDWGHTALARIILVVDKVHYPATLRPFQNNPLFKHKSLVLLIVLDQEYYQRWPEQDRRQLEAESRFQLWPVSCLWEDKYRPVERIFSALMGKSQDSPEQQHYQRFQKAIAFKGRGQMGAIIREMCRAQYWRFTDQGEPFIDLNRLDDSLIEHLARSQDLLEQHWSKILSGYFVSQAETDRAKLGVYAVLDWIEHSGAMFSEEQLFNFADSQECSVLISSHQHVRHSVVQQLLDVLVDNHALYRNGYFYSRSPLPDRMPSATTRPVDVQMAPTRDIEATIPKTNADKSFPQALPSNYVLNQYRLETVLGAGSFGITYRAIHEQLGDRAAIKEYFPADWAMREGIKVKANASGLYPFKDSAINCFDWGQERFLDEARTLAKIKHHGVVRVRDFFTANGTAYIVMDYEAGEPLSNTLKNKKTLPEDQVLPLLQQTLAALDAVHQAHFLHRDLKPHNIYLRAQDQQAMLIDFGAARQALGHHTSTLTSILTPGYAPIEQYDSEAQKHGPWTDLYAIGAVIYHCIAGVVPVEAPKRVIEDTLQPITEIGKGYYAAPLLNAVDRALAIFPEQRFANVGEFQQALLAKVD